MPAKKKHKSAKVVSRRSTKSSGFSSESEEHHAFLLILAGGLVVILCLYFLGGLNMMHLSPQYKPLDQVMQPATSSGTMQDTAPSTMPNGY